MALGFTLACDVGPPSLGSFHRPSRLLFPGCGSRDDRRFASLWSEKPEDAISYLRGQGQHSICLTGTRAGKNLLVPKVGLMDT